MDEGDPLIPRQSDLTISYLRIPLKAGIQIFDYGKLNFNPSIGLNTAFQVNSNEMTTYEDDAKRESYILTRGLNKTQLGLNIDLEFEFNVNENLSFKFIPYISKGLNKLNDNAMSSGQFSYGGQLGVFYRAL